MHQVKRWASWAATFAAVLASIGSRATAQVSGTWVGGSGGNLNDPANWSSNPLVPGGGGTATIIGSSGTFSGALTLSGLIYSASGAGTISTIDLTGPASLNVSSPWIGSSDDRLLATHRIGLSNTNIPVTKIGAGATRITGGNSASTLTINSGTLVAQSGLNSAHGTIALNGGAIWFAPDVPSYPRPIVFGAAGGTLSASSNGGLGLGTVSGSGALNITAGGFAYFSTHTGPTRILGGGEQSALFVNGEARIATTSSIEVSGRLVLTGSTAAAQSRLGTSTPVTLSTGTYELTGETGRAINEQAGVLNIGGGINRVLLDSSGGRMATRATFASLARPTRGRVIFTGTNLGATPGPGVSSVFFSTPPTLSGSGAIDTPSRGIIPFAGAAATGTFGSFATYDPAVGIRSLRSTEYVTTLPAGASNNNAIVTITSGSLSNNASISVNSLELRAIGDFFTANLSGSGTITVTSGAFAASSIWQISNALNFGSVEGIISGGTINGPIIGTNGVTFAGANAGSFSRSYTGTTTFMGQGGVNGTVLPGVNGPLGNSTTPVVIFGDSPPVSPTFANFGTRFGFSGTFGRDMIVNSPAAAINPPQIGGAAGAVLSGSVTLNGPALLNGTGWQVTGNITGSGELRIGDNAPGALASDITLSGINTYGRGTRVDNATLTIGSDTALSNVPLQLGPNSVLKSSGGTRTIANPITVFADSSITTFPPPVTLEGAMNVNGAISFVNALTTGSLTIRGGQQVTMNGDVNLSGRRVTMNSTVAPLTINGAIGDGTLVMLSGSTLTLAGNNSYLGTFTVSDGTHLRVLSNKAMGSALFPTRVEGNNVLELANNAQVSNEALFIRGGGTLTAPGGALRSMSGNTAWNGTITLTGATTVHVAAGTLSLGGQMSGGTNTLTKTGGGTLAMRNVRLAGLTVSAGTVQVQSNGTDAGAGTLQTLNLNVVTQIPQGALDVNNNDIVIASSSGATVRSLIARARNGGAWNQTGITSLAARNDSRTSLGLITGAQFHSAYGPSATFDGFAVADTDSLIKYTWNGDTDLNGVVDFDDYSRTDNGFNNGGTDWFHGDFDYNGIVDFDDYSLIDQAFNTQNAVLLPGNGMLSQSVPEPELLSLATLISLFAVRRRATRPRRARGWGAFR